MLIPGGVNAHTCEHDHGFLPCQRFIFSNFPLQVLVGITFAATMQWTAKHHFGFFYEFPFLKNNWLLFIATFIFLDFGEYIYHVIMHRIKRRD